MAISRFAHNGDVRIHYLDSGGTDDRAPIVFVPGMTDVADDYAEVLPLFGRRTVVMELRGHGRSDSPARGYGVDELTADVGAVVDAVTDGPVHIVTFSRGTTYAIAWVLENRRRVRSVSIGDYVPEEKVLPPGAPRFLLDGRWRGSPVSERLDEEAALKTFSAAKAQSHWEALAALDIPLLAIRSGGSVLVPDQDWARYVQMFPRAELVEFPDSPHDIFRPDRGRYPRLVRDHVESTERADHGH